MSRHTGSTGPRQPHKAIKRSQNSAKKSRALGNSMCSAPGGSPWNCHRSKASEVCTEQEGPSKQAVLDTREDREKMELGVNGEVSKVSRNSEPPECLEGRAAVGVVCQMAGCSQNQLGATEALLQTVTEHLVALRHCDTVLLGGPRGLGSGECFSTDQLHLDIKVINRAPKGHGGGGCPGKLQAGGDN